MHAAIAWVSKYANFYLAGGCIEDFDMKILKHRMGALHKILTKRKRFALNLHRFGNDDDYLSFRKTHRSEDCINRMLERSDAIMLLNNDLRR